MKIELNDRQVVIGALFLAIVFLFIDRSFVGGLVFSCALGVYSFFLFLDRTDDRELDDLKSEVQKLKESHDNLKLKVLRNG